MIKELQSREELYLTFTDEEVAELGWKKGQKFTFKLENDGTVRLIPYSTLELDFDEFTKEELINLMQVSCDRDISINEVIAEVLEDVVEKGEEIVKENQDPLYIRLSHYEQYLKSGVFWEMFPNACGDFEEDCAAYGRYLDRITKLYGANNSSYRPVSMFEWLKCARKEDFNLSSELDDFNHSW